MTTDHDEAYYQEKFENLTPKQEKLNGISWVLLDGLGELFKKVILENFDGMKEEEVYAFMNLKGIGDDFQSAFVLFEEFQERLDKLDTDK